MYKIDYDEQLQEVTVDHSSKEKWQETMEFYLYLNAKLDDVLAKIAARKKKADE